MDKLSIKIKIANRVYPLSIKPEEEEGIRKAANLINEMIHEFEMNYAVKDKQDLIAMAALKLATNNPDVNGKQVIENNELINKLKEIEEKLSI
ncbi:MAG: hypothetical protein Kow0079_09510 [Vicingaceae bacterium]|jgi:cell division protein ZapA